MKLQPDNMFACLILLTAVKVVPASVAGVFDLFPSSARQSCRVFSDSVTDVEFPVMKSTYLKGGNYGFAIPSVAENESVTFNYLISIINSFQS